MLAYGPINWSIKSKCHFTFFYIGIIQRSCECNYSMFVVVGYTWRVWDWIWGFYNHILWQPKYYSISTDSTQMQLTKHIEIHMHYIKGFVHDGIIALHYCASSEQVVDIFTKEFSEKTFNNIKSPLGIDDHVVNIYWRAYLIQFCSCLCLREDFPLCGFASFLVLHGQARCKGWLSLVSRPYIYDIFLIFHIS